MKIDVFSQTFFVISAAVCYNKDIIDNIPG